MIAAVAALALHGAAHAGDDAAAINRMALYPEGPLAIGDTVTYAEMGGDLVTRWDGQDNRTFWSRPGCGPTAVAEAGGDLIVLCHLEGSAVRVSRSGETLAVYSQDGEGRRLVNPNAAVGDGNGGVYFSDSGPFSPSAPAAGSALHLDAAGRIARVATGIHYANGVALTADGGTLYVSEHLSRRVLAFDVGADGRLSRRRVFVELDDLVGVDPDRGWEVGPDGLAVDRAGDLYIAEYGAGHVLIVGRDRRLKATITVPEAYVTAAALSPDEREITITAPVSLHNPSAFGAVYVAANPIAEGR